MARVVIHCGLKVKSVRYYEVLDYGDAAKTLLWTAPCPRKECGKQAIAFQKRLANGQDMHLFKNFSSKRDNEEFQRLIDDRIARQIDDPDRPPIEAPGKERRGGYRGVGVWSQKATRDTNQLYILRIERFIRGDRDGRYRVREALQPQRQRTSA